MKHITGSIQEKSNKLYAVISYYDSNGKRQQKWISTGYLATNNKRNAQKFLTDLLAKYNNEDAVFCNLTVDKYFSEWLNDIQATVRANTYRSYFGNMTNHIIPYFKAKKIPLQNLKPRDLEEYYNSLLAKGSRMDGTTALSPTTIKHHHQNISKALTDAVRKGYINTNPASAVKTPKTEKYKGNFLNSEQIQQLLILFKGSAIELPVILTAAYGFRRSEVLGLKWSSVDFVNKTITVSETLQQNTGGSYTDKPKTDCSFRTLPLFDYIENILREKKREQEDLSALLGNYYVTSDYVCTRKNGAVIEPNYLTRTFGSILSKSTLPKIRFHDLRHSAASNLLAMGFSVVEVQEWLGHESAATTLKFYAHVDKSSKLAISKKLEALYSDSGEKNC